MGLVLSAAAGRGWTTGSGMEGPAALESDSADRAVSTFPWSLFTKSPRRRMRVAFTCNVCGQRTTRAINPHAYTDGTVFVQCCGCNIFHKLVDNLNLFHEMKCYVNPSFRYKGDVNFNFLDGDDDEFPSFLLENVGAEELATHCRTTPSSLQRIIFQGRKIYCMRRQSHGAT
ncbi:hypothetical protein AXF42_Ash009806 [Apostasia shenzhenica]|uniref:DNL-type domain-containing protein n=1 Tax=Apostasia shenzhenica TaxID=1088818 RepID=A0A2I0AX53_9ASPA|nr:hypothetical protein AXF42_Ash009806 [Apostasia shenzhenica]